MTVGTGIGKYIGFGQEATYGVPVTPTVWVPLIDSTMKKDVGRLMSTGVIAGARAPRSQQWSSGDITCDGGVQMELFDRSIGKLLRWCFGSVVTSGPVGSTYSHTYTMGDLIDDSFTMGIVNPDVNGTADPFTYMGAMNTSWEIGLAAGEIATFAMDNVARDEAIYRTVADGVTNATATVTSATSAFGEADLFLPISGTNIPANSYVGVINSPTSIGLSSSNVTNVPVVTSGSGAAGTLVMGIAATAATYAAGIAPLTYVGGSVSLGGAVANVKKMTIGVKNPFADKRRFLGQARIKQPLENDLREPGGSMTLEFEDYTQYRRYLNAQELAMVFSIRSMVPGSVQSVVFTANVRFDGGTPQISGRDVGEIEIPYVCVGPTTDAGALTAVYNTTEATP